MPQFPQRAVALIAAGERLGNLQPTLARLLNDPRDEDEDAAEADSFARWYPLLMTVAFSILLMLLIVFVVPKMIDLCKDFGVKLPFATVTLMHIGRALDDLAFMPLLIAFVVVSTLLGGAFRRIVSGRQTITLGLFDRILWRLPIAHSLARNRGLGDVCNTMAIALSAGYPLPRAIEETEMLQLNVVLRERLGTWRAGIEKGAAADQAARAARLPALLCGMIGSGRGGDPAAAMKFLATYYDGRFSRARELLRAAIVPAMAIFFGGIVLFMASGTYLPLLQMMDKLNETALQVSK
jgi:type II secretory pathway component PulF